VLILTSINGFIDPKPDATAYCRYVCNAVPTIQLHQITQIISDRYHLLEHYHLYSESAGSLLLFYFLSGKNMNKQEGINIIRGAIAALMAETLLTQLQ